MKKLFIFAVAICAFFFVAPSSMFAEAKNAFLIANASYSTAPLPTPIQESRGLKKTLEKLGFAVTLFSLTERIISYLLTLTFRTSAAYPQGLWTWMT